MLSFLLARTRANLSFSNIIRPRAPTTIKHPPSRGNSNTPVTTPNAPVPQQPPVSEPPLPPATTSIHQRAMARLIFTTKLCFFIHLIASHVVMISPCEGASMLPTFPAEMHSVLVSRLHKLGRGVQVGDVVSLRHPMFPGQMAAKRVVGMPGDYIIVDPLEERKVMLRVPPGHCYVMGDNLSHSRDSRHYGPIPLGLLEGKVVARLSWPPKVIKRPYEVVQ